MVPGSTAAPWTSPTSKYLSVGARDVSVCGCGFLLSSLFVFHVGSTRFYSGLKFVEVGVAFSLLNIL